MANGRPIWYTQMLDNTELERGAQQSRRIWQTIENDANQSGIRVGKIWQTAGAAVAGYLSVQAVQQFARQVVDIRGQFQQLEIAFGTMLKSGDRAKQLMGELSQFAATTPFGLQSSASAAKQLLAYGSAAETVIDELRMLGDVAAGTSQPIGDIVYLYGTLRTQGRAYMMDIRQFAGRGIPIYDELAKVLGTSKDKVNEFVSAGKVGFKEIEQAFKNMTSSGGMYGGLMEAQSKSITGRIEQLRDGFDLMFNKIGQSSEGVIYEAIDGASSLVENYEQVGRVLAGIIVTYGAYRAAVIANNVVLGIQQQMLLQTALSGQALTKWQALQSVATTRLSAVTNVLNKTMLANPYVLVATLLVGLVAGMWALSDSSTAAERAQERLNKRQEEFAQKEQERRSRIEELIRTIQDETQTEYAKIAAYEELQRMSPALTDAYSREKLAVADLAATNKRLNEEQDARNFDELISNIDKTRAKISTLKEELDLLRKAQSTSGGAGFAFQIGKISDEIKVQENSLAKYRKNLEEHNRLMAEAEFNALPPAEKIKIKEEQLAKIRSEFERVKAVLEEEEAKLADRPYYYISPQLRAEVDGLRRQEKSAQSEVDKLKNAQTTTTSEPTKEEKKRWAAEAKRRKEEAERSAKELEKLEEKFADNVAQARVDGIVDNFEREMAQNQLNHLRRLAQIKKDRQELLAERQKRLPKGQTATLTDKEEFGYNSQENASTVQLNKDNKATLDADKKARQDALDGFRSFEQEYLRLYAEFQEKRKKAIKNGADEAGLTKADFDFEESIKKLATDFAESVPEFKEWADGIKKIVDGATEDGATQVLQNAITQLDSALEIAKSEANKLLDGGIAEGEGEAYKIALAKIIALEKELKKLRAESNISPNKRSIKEWQELYSTLQDIEKEFSEIGNVIGGEFGKGLASVGNLTTGVLQMVDGIMTLKAGVDATGKSLSALDKASVILAAVGAVFQILNSFAGDQQAYEAERLRQQEGYWEAINFQIEEQLKLLDKLYSHEYYNKAQEALDLYNKGFKNALNAAKDIENFNGNMYLLLDRLEQYDKAGWKKGSGNYDRALNAEVDFYNKNRLSVKITSKDIKEAEELYAVLKDLNEESIRALAGNAEVWSKLPAATQKAVLQAIEYLDKQKELEESRVDAIYGQDIQSAIEDFASAYADAWTNGVPTEDAIKKQVREVIKAQVMEMIKSAPELLEALEYLRGTLLPAITADGIITSDEWKLVENLSNGVASSLDAAYGGYADLFKDAENAARTSAAQGFAQASQDSIDSLSGIFTNIENHTYEMREMMKTSQDVMRSNMRALLADVSAIRVNTNRLENIEEHLLTTTEKLDDMVDGINAFTRG